MLKKFQYGLVTVMVLSLGLFAIACSEEEVEEATNTTNASAAASTAKDAGVTKEAAKAAKTIYQKAFLKKMWISLC